MNALVLKKVALTGTLLAVSFLGVGCGRGPVTAPTSQNPSGAPSIVSVSNVDGSNVGLAASTWTAIQEIAIEAKSAGYLHLNAYGGESVTQILPPDDYRFSGLRTLMGIASDGSTPMMPGTFAVACCADGSFPYRVAAYSLGETVFVPAPGVYKYVVLALSPRGGGKTSVRPGTFTAMFFPE